MKIMTLILLFTLSTEAFSHTIKGTLVLKGSLKTNVFVRNKLTSCRVRIEKIKNLLDEDSFGNPAYNVRTHISVDSINYDREVWLINLFNLDSNKSEVRDHEYHSEDDSIKMKIDDEGRIKTVLVRYKDRDISCLF